MNVKEDFAERLKQLREIAGLNQSQLADKLKVSRGSISYYENCDRVPDIEFLYNASLFFGVPVDYLLGCSDNKKEENKNFGLITGLSDKAIENLLETNSDSDVINLILENENFYDVVNLISDYIQIDILSSCKVITKHIADKEYIEFLISKYIINILCSTKSRYRYSKLTKDDINKIFDKSDKTIERYNNFKKSCEEQSSIYNKNYLEIEAQNISIRKKIQDFLNNGGGPDGDDNEEE